MAKNIEMQVLSGSSYEAIYPVPANHKNSHKTGGADAISPSDIGAVPTSRTVNGKALSANITLSASDVSAYSKSETNTLLQNKAPAGYGLGGNSRLLTADDNIDTLMDNGWYCWEPSNAPQGTLPTTVLPYATQIRVTNLSATCYQEAVDTTNSAHHGCMLRRTIYGTTVYPWEFVNPAMGLDTEYRTTERIRGNAVYKKNVNGVIYYRIDGEAEWKPYANVVGAYSKTESNTTFAPAYTYSTADLSAGSSALSNGKLYLVYE